MAAMLRFSMCALILNSSCANGPKQKTQPHGWVLDKFSISLGHLGHVVGLRAFLALHDLELHLITFLKTLITFRLYGAVVDEYIWSTFLTDKSKTLSVVEPLDSAFNSRHLHIFLFPSGTEQLRPDPNFQSTLGDCARRLTSHARSGLRERREGNSWGPSEVTGWLRLCGKYSLIVKGVNTTAGAILGSTQYLGAAL